MPIEGPFPPFLRYFFRLKAMAQEVEHVHPHAAVFHQFSIGGDVLKVSCDQQLKEDHGVDRGVAGPAIKFLRVPIKKT